MRRLAILLALSASPAALADKLSVDDAVQLALKANPRVRAQRERAGAAHDQARSARGRLGFAVRLSEEYQRWDCAFAISFPSFAGTCAPPKVNPMTTFVARDTTTNTFAATIDQPLVGLLHSGFEFAAQSEN